MLWTDLITPAELTGYARASLESRERAKGTLARWLPNRTVADIVARLVVGSNGLVSTAEYRSYDAETSIGSMPGGQRTTVELPPLGRKLRVSEYDQLRMRGAAAEELVLTSVERVTDQLVASVSNRIELERGKAIENAAFSISENGFTQTGSWSRDAGHTVTAPILWSTTATAVPLDNLATWKAVYNATNGEDPGAMVMSSRVLAALARTQEFRALAASLAGTPSIVSRQAVDQVLAAHDMPPIYIYDRQVKVGATTTKVLSDNKIYLLPAPVDVNAEDGTDLGATMWGQTLESGEPEYGIAPLDQPGIVAGAWKTRDPIGVWVHTAAIALPVLANANLSLVATVL